MRIFVLLCFFITPILAHSQARRGLALIAKDKTEEAYQLLIKEVKKDSLASAEKYVLATLFFNPNYSKENLDSAYYYILNAIAAFANEDDKSTAKLINNGFSNELFAELKATIEDAGFARAKKGGLEQDYIDFLNDFSTSLMVDSAVILRNIEGFIIAKKTNSYNSYKKFLDKYPEANDAIEADKRYEKLLFEDKTVDGSFNLIKNF